MGEAPSGQECFIPGLFRIAGGTAEISSGLARSASCCFRFLQIRPLLAAPGRATPTTPSLKLGAPSLAWAVSGDRLPIYPVAKT